MIYLHKILPFFLLPTGVTLLLVVAGLLLRRRGLCWAGIAVLWLSTTPVVGNFLMRATEGGQIRQPIAAAPKAQAIVVLSGGRRQPPGDTTVSEWGDANRFYGGIELFKAQKAPLLIFTGGWAPWRPDAKPEGDVLIGYAAELGVPRDRMLTTGRVMSTEEEARAVADLLARQPAARGTQQILLVTSAFQMRRAVLQFSNAGLSVVPFPVDFKVSQQEQLTVLSFIPNAGSLGSTETALREFYGRLYYQLFSS
jgi:uncharacterized SAM-binding protein YcdF (DUF218 family)